MISEKYNEENTKKVQELTVRLTNEYERRAQILRALNNATIIQLKEIITEEEEKQELFRSLTDNGTFAIVQDCCAEKTIRGVFELLIERAQSVIASGYEGLGVQDLKDLAFNEYGIDMEEKHD